MRSLRTPREPKADLFHLFLCMTYRKRWSEENVKRTVTSLRPTVTWCGDRLNLSAEDTLCKSIGHDQLPDAGGSSSKT